MKKKYEWIKTKESFLRWQSKTKIKDIMLKKIQFKGYSLWWSCKSTNNDIILDNKWFLDLNEVLNNRIRNKTIQKTSYLILILKLFKNFFKDLFYILFLKTFFHQKKKISNKKNCYLSVFNNTTNFRNFYLDRQFSLAPLYKKKANSLLIQFAFNNKIFFNLKKTKKNLNKTNLDYFILHHYISYREVAEIYIKTIILFFKTFLLMKDSYFIINKKNCSNILKPLILDSFFGNIQATLINSIAVKNFLLSEKYEKFISYYQFFPGARAIYYFVKNLKKAPKIVSLQHGIYAKNNLFLNLNKKDFSSKINYRLSPQPDVFFTQGIEYSNYLKKIFPKNKIFTVGSFKFDLADYKSNKINFREKTKEGKKLVIVITAIKDENYMIGFLNKCDLSNCKIIICPHFVYKNETIKNFKNKAKFQFSFLKKYSTRQIMFFADLVVCGMSSMSYEAMFKNLNVLRITDYSSPMQSDESDNIPLISESNKFQNFLKKRRQIPINLRKNTEKKLFYKFDRKTHLRFTRILEKI